MADFDPTTPLPGTDTKLFARFMSKVDITAGCWLWTGCKTNNGYGSFCGIRFEGAHRTSFEFFCAPIPKGIYVCHTCDVRHCVNPAHLWLGTQKDNLRDASAKGRMSGDGHAWRTHPESILRGDKHWTKFHPDRICRGENMTGSKLTGEDVRRIRDLHASEGVNMVTLARMFGVAPSNIYMVVTRKTWKHIP